MNHINIKKFAFAFGSTCAILYFGCAMTMFIFGHDSTVNFFNTMFHGLDISSISRMDITPVDELIGLVQIFILGGLFGACIAFIYNVSFNKKV